VETVDIPVPADLAGKIGAIAFARHVSRDRAMADLLREAITAYERRREVFRSLLHVSGIPLIAPEVRRRMVAKSSNDAKGAVALKIASRIC
jgi:hypothetical protein